MNTKNTLTCPQCGATIDIDEVLIHQLEDKVKKDLEAKHSQKEQELQKKLNELQDEEDKIKKAKENLRDTVNKQVQDKVRDEKTKLEKSIRQQIEDEKSDQVKELQKELTEKSTQLRELNKTKAKIERLKREKDELADKIALEKEKEFTEKLRDERGKIKKQAEEENLLKFKELEKQLEDQRKLAAEMKRKAEQGSMQLQGEVQELELKNILLDLHRWDEIVEVKKGQKGADILQIVKTKHGLECGKIYYESKRVKNFSNSWIQKLRDDNLEVKADVLVLVTKTLPEDIDKFGQKDGVWICSFNEVKGLSVVLRHGLEQVHSMTVKQEDKGSKRELLYIYLTSQEFRGQFEAILEGFRSLQNSYTDEKLKMQKIWKEREKQLEKILTNAVDFYGSLKGIAGTSIPDIKMLEGGQPKLN